MIDFDSIPDFMNEKGVKWWRDVGGWNYARRKGLVKVQVWATEMPDGERDYVIVDKGKAVQKCKTLEEVGAWIDVEAFLRSKDLVEPH